MQIGSLPAHDPHRILIADHRTDPASEIDPRRSTGRVVDDEGVAQTTPSATDRNQDSTETVVLLGAIPNSLGSTAVLGLTLPIDGTVPAASAATPAAPAESRSPDRSIGVTVAGGERAELSELALGSPSPVEPSLAAAAAPDPSTAEAPAPDTAISESASDAGPTTTPGSGTEVAAGTSGGSGRAELSEEEHREVEELKSRDREVRQHEQAHAAAGGPYTRGGPSYEYTTGPDNRRYATGGEVEIDTSKVPDDPAGTVRKMQVVYRAAMAPAEPSGADRAVASEAKQKESEARAELMEARRVDAADGAKTEEEAAGLSSPRSETTGASASESADGGKSETLVGGEFGTGFQPGRIVDEMA